MIHKHRQTRLLCWGNTHCGPGLSLPIGLDVPLWLFNPIKERDLSEVSLLYWKLSQASSLFFYTLLISQAQGRSTYLCEPPIHPLPPKAGPFPGQFERMWLPSLHLGFWPPTKLDKECAPSNLPHPNFCWLLLLGRSAHRVIQVSLRGPLLTVPLSLASLLLNPPSPSPLKKPRASWPQGRLLGNLWNLKPPASSSHFPSGETVDCPSWAATCRQKGKGGKELSASWVWDTLASDLQTNRRSTCLLPAGCKRWTNPKESLSFPSCNTNLLGLLQRLHEGINTDTWGKKIKKNKKLKKNHTDTWTSTWRIESAPSA